MKKYRNADLRKMFNLQEDTVRARMSRKNGKQRWGVEKEVVEVVQYFVPEDKLYLWEEDFKKKNAKK